MSNYIAFHGDPAIKQKFVERARGHRLADEIVQDYYYWKKGKGCAIGCLAHVNICAHEVLERETGYPITINRLGDVIFESFARERKDLWVYWPERFIDAAPVGADLSKVPDQWMYWLLSEELPQYVDAKYTDVLKSLSSVEALYRRRLNGDEPSEVEWWDAARDAEDSARAVRPAEEAEAAARVAARAAWAAWGTMKAVELSASWGARGTAWSAARVTCCERMADKLIEFLKAAPQASNKREINDE